MVDKNEAILLYVIMPNPETLPREHQPQGIERYRQPVELTLDEQDSLFKLVRFGEELKAGIEDPDELEMQIINEAEQAKGLIANNYLQLVLSMAFIRKRNRSFDVEDLVQAGCIGLMEAVVSHAKNDAIVETFPSYAKTLIGYSMQKEITVQLTHLAIGSDKRREITVYREAFKELGETLGREPSFKEMASFLDMSIEDSYRRWLTLDNFAPIDPDDIKFIEDQGRFIDLEEDAPQNREAAIYVERALELITPVHSVALKIAFGISDDPPETVNAQKMTAYISMGLNELKQVVNEIESGSLDLVEWSEKTENRQRRNVMVFCAKTGINMPHDQTLEEIRAEARAFLESLDIPESHKSLLIDRFGLNIGGKAIKTQGLIDKYGFKKQKMLDIERGLFSRCKT